MAVITRRDFARAGLSVVAVGAFMPTIFTRALAHASFDRNLSASGSTSNKTLIIIQLAGGNDGLNTVVPFADPNYRKLRPTLGVADNQLIKLNDRLALHPSLKSLKSLWDANQLAIVENVGY